MSQIDPSQIDPSPIDPTRDTSFFGHPRGLGTLFFTEMWERFSYYGMRAILVLYMVHELNSENPGMHLTTEMAAAIYGIYTGMVYLLALPGGWIADRVLGQRRAVFLGGCIIAAGHFSMAIPSTPSFFLGLVLIVIGTGLLKPNISAMVQDFYPEGGERRDAGFSIFYMGINIGAFVSPLVCGYLGEQINWHYGFGAAGVGMVLGLIQYALGGKYLGEAGKFHGTDAQRRQDRSRLLMALGGVGLVFAIIVALQWQGAIHLTFPLVARFMTGLILVIAVLYLVTVAFFSGLEPVERRRIGVIAVLFLAAALFWSGFEQAGSSMNIFASDLTDRMIGGWEMPASWLQSANALMIIALAPVFAWLWVWLGRRSPSSPMKFALGLIFLGLGFVVLAWGALLTGSDGTGNVKVNLVSPNWLIVTYLLHTIGELCLSPVGLSTMTKLSPARYVGQMMGVWFMATALGNVIAGLVAGTLGSRPEYEIFAIVACIVAGGGLLLAVVSRPVRNWMGGVR